MDIMTALFDKGNTDPPYGGILPPPRYALPPRGEWNAPKGAFF